MRKNKQDIQLRQNKIILQLMLVSLVILSISLIIIIGIWLFNIGNSKLDLMQKSFFNLAIILLIGFIILPKLYNYFDKIINLLDITNHLKEQIKNIDQISEELNQTRNKVKEIQKNTLKKINQFRIQNAKKRNEIKKKVLAEAEKRWKQKWEKKFKKLENKKKR